MSKMLSAECLNKQIIDLGWQSIDQNTIKVLKKGNRYKLFKFEIKISDRDLDRFL